MRLRHLGEWRGKNLIEGVDRGLSGRDDVHAGQRIAATQTNSRPVAKPADDVVQQSLHVDDYDRCLRLREHPRLQHRGKFGQCSYATGKENEPLGEGQHAPKRVGDISSREDVVSRWMPLMASPHGGHSDANQCPAAAGYSVRKCRHRARVRSTKNGLDLSSSNELPEAVSLIENC